MKIKIEPIKGIENHTLIFGMDGLNHKLFTRMIKENKLPNIKKYIYDRALIRIDQALSTFPSITTFAHETYLTGKKSRFALKEYHKELKKIFNYDKMWALAEQKACEKNITLHHLIQPSATVLENANKGANKKYRYTHLAFPILRGVMTQIVSNITYNKLFWDKRAPTSPFINLLLSIDRTVTKKTVDLFRKKNIPKLTTIWYTGMDNIAHRLGESPVLRYTYRLLDHYLGYICRTLEKRNLLDKFIIVFLSDHGSSQVKQNININRLLRKKGLKYDLIVETTGFNVVATHFNAATCYLYLTKQKYPTTKNPKLKKLINILLNEKSTDFLVARANGCVEIIARNKVARVHKKLENGTAKYCLEGDNVLDFKFKNKTFKQIFNKNKYHTEEELHIIIHDQKRPVMISDIWHLFAERKESPDIILTAKQGYDYSKSFKATHGLATRESMTLPLIFAGNKKLIKPIKLDSARLNHVAPTLLELLGVERKKIYSYDFDTKTLQHLNENKINKQFKRFKSR